MLTGMDYYAFGADPVEVRAARFMRENGPKIASYLGQVSADTAALQRLRRASHAKANARKYGTAAEQNRASANFANATRSRAAEIRQLREQESAPGFLEQLTAGLGQVKTVAMLGIGAILLSKALDFGTSRNNRSRGNRP